MERIPSAQPPPLSKHQAVDVSDLQGMDFPMYVYKPRRGMKRGEECKETYKLPHRLIEKKRRDRINECIAQLKDLLPEHLKLTTLGHLEKAVVLELTLKHVKALTSLLEQQQQKILALQSGMKIESVSQDKSSELFQSGFHMCAKEVLQYLATTQEASRDLSPSHLVSHLRTLAAHVLQSPPVTPRPHEAPSRHKDTPVGLATALPDGEGYGRNCVPVIQRAYPPGGGELSGSDTDTDSGYGGELEKAEPPQGLGSAYYGQDGHLKRGQEGERRGSGVKQEGGEPPHKRARAQSSEEESSESGGESSSSSSSSSSGHGSYMSLSPLHPPHPLCMPFYLLPPTATAAYLPILEKCWYPMLYGQRLAPPHLMLSPRGGGSSSSPIPTMDSPGLLQTLKQLPPLSLEAKD